MLKFKWAKDNQRYWSSVDRRIEGFGEYLSQYRGSHMKILSRGVWDAYRCAGDDVIHAVNLAAAGRDREAMEWFREALDLFDTALAAHNSESAAEPSAGEMYRLYTVSHATYLADWAAAGANDVQRLGRALRFERLWLALEGQERFTDPERNGIFVSALVEAEDRDAALQAYRSLHPDSPSLESMCALGTPGSMACALMLAESEPDGDTRASVYGSYERFLSTVIRYDRNGARWPFSKFDFIRFQYLRHKYIERHSPSVLQLIREARGV